MINLFLHTRTGKTSRVLLDDDMVTKVFSKTFYNDGSYIAFREHWRGPKIYLHRFITNVPKGMVVDHINGNKLDNRRENLRICTQSENMANHPRNANNKSGFKGVFYKQENGRFMAYITKDRKRINLGHYSTALEASEAYRIAANKIFGQYAWKGNVSL